MTSQAHPHCPVCLLAAASSSFMRYIIDQAHKAVLATFIKRLDGSTITADSMKTADVCQAYVIPQTQLTMCALIDLS